MKNIIRLFALLLIFTLSLIAIRASQPQLYMVLKQGAAGLDFYCANTPVYEDTIPYGDGDSEQSEAEYSVFALHPESLELYAQVVRVQDCNVDNLYSNDGGTMFVWQFDRRVTDGHLDHRHMISHGAWWIRLLDFGQE